jgi:hypothetical protein
VMAPHAMPAHATRTLSPEHRNPPAVVLTTSADANAKAAESGLIALREKREVRP